MAAVRAAVDAARQVAAGLQRCGEAGQIAPRRARQLSRSLLLAAAHVLQSSTWQTAPQQDTSELLRSLSMPLSPAGGPGLCGCCHAPTAAAALSVLAAVAGGLRGADCPRLARATCSLAVEILRANSAHGDSRVRTAALRGAAAIARGVGSAAPLPSLRIVGAAMRRLCDPDTGVCGAACTALCSSLPGARGGQALQNELVARAAVAARHPAAATRALAARVISLCGGASAERLLEGFKHDDWGGEVKGKTMESNERLLRTQRLALQSQHSGAAPPDAPQPEAAQEAAPQAEAGEAQAPPAKRRRVDPEPAAPTEQWDGDGAVLWCLEDDVRAVRKEALRSVRRLGQERADVGAVAISFIVDLCVDDSDEVRAAALRCISRWSQHVQVTEEQVRDLLLDALTPREADKHLAEARWRALRLDAATAAVMRASLAALRDLRLPSPVTVTAVCRQLIDLLYDPGLGPLWPDVRAALQGIGSRHADWMQHLYDSVAVPPSAGTAAWRGLMVLLGNAAAKEPSLLQLLPADTLRGLVEMRHHFPYLVPNLDSAAADAFGLPPEADDPSAGSPPRGESPMSPLGDLWRPFAMSGGHKSPLLRAADHAVASCRQMPMRAATLSEVLARVSEAGLLAQPITHVALRWLRAIQCRAVADAVAAQVLPVCKAVAALRHAAAHRSRLSQGAQVDHADAEADRNIAKLAADIADAPDAAAAAKVASGFAAAGEHPFGARPMDAPEALIAAHTARLGAILWVQPKPAWGTPVNASLRVQAVEVALAWRGSLCSDLVVPVVTRWTGGRPRQSFTELDRRCLSPGKWELTWRVDVDIMDVLQGNRANEARVRVHLKMNYDPLWLPGGITGAVALCRSTDVVLPLVHDSPPGFLSTLPQEPSDRRRVDQIKAVAQAALRPTKLRYGVWAGGLH
eukprot:TRINITY_DN25560_c0_g1_i1.p1 TRINITY_DN25560_c0_g1~~TRINITY_DN25560_c0_g1_i1.p1  ORF type:complete len:917 (+),score=183.46 TRINITY_DN25560_c0_g1_i1:207-2957(+)